FRNKYLDYAIKFAVALSVFQSFLPTSMSALTLFFAGSLLLVRWLIWRPDLGLRRFGNAVMYVGYFGLTLHLFFEVLKLTGVWSQGAFSIHVFTLLCMGMVIPGMIVRISQGHTGRKLQFL